MMTPNPTPDAALNEVLREFVSGLETLLKDNLLAVYLQGSFALGDWDEHSDVDFMVAIERELSDTQISGLQAMHGSIFDMDIPWAQHLEGSYIPKAILERPEPSQTPLLYLDNTSRELVFSEHQEDTLVSRWVTRKHGITLTGKSPYELLAPVTTRALQQEVSAYMRYWAERIIQGTYSIRNRWVQPYVVLSYCRMLYTLSTGEVTSKRAGAQWAQENLEARWRSLIQRAVEARPYPSQKAQEQADEAEVERTLMFIRYVLEVGSEIWK